MHIKILHFLLKHFQQRGLYEIGVNFDYYPIDENDLFNFLDHYPNVLSSEMDPRPVFTFPTSRKLLDSLESIGIEFEHSCLPFNEEPTYSSCVIRESTSFAPDSISASIVPQL